MPTKNIFVTGEIDEEEYDILMKDLIDLALTLGDNNDNRVVIPLRILQLFIYGYWIHEKEIAK